MGQADGIEIIVECILGAIIREFFLLERVLLALDKLRCLILILRASQSQLIIPFKTFFV